MNLQKLIDITGQKFNMLTVIRFSHFSEDRKRNYWLCQCDCGGQKVVSKDDLKSGNTKSCGCLSKMGNPKHGFRHTRLYNIWCCMKQRCNNKNHHKYKDYGGRGIKVCDEWKEDFQAFYDCVSKLPHFNESDYTLDRINNDGNYEPGNVRWATMKEQRNNRRGC